MPRSLADDDIESIQMDRRESGPEVAPKEPPATTGPPDDPKEKRSTKRDVENVPIHEGMYQPPRFDARFLREVGRELNNRQHQFAHATQACSDNPSKHTSALQSEARVLLEEGLGEAKIHLSRAQCDGVDSGRLEEVIHHGHDALEMDLVVQTVVNPPSMQPNEAGYIVVNRKKSKKAPIPVASERPSEVLFPDTVSESPSLLERAQARHRKEVNLIDEARRNC